MFGVYVHVPYCRAVCPYCDFNVCAAKHPPWEAFTRAVVAQLRQRWPLFAGLRAAGEGGDRGRLVRTVYFGGGTPSLAPVSFFEAVLGTLAELESATAGGGGERIPYDEITVEAEPATVDLGALQAYRRMGVSRLSIGWQSSQEQRLRLLGRQHSVDDTLQLVAAARQAGFEHLNLDLIFAVPGQTVADLDADLHALMALDPTHVALYALTYHEGTPFHRRRARGDLVAIEDDLEAQMMERIATTLVQEGGYEHYEVSNFARPGHRALHNSSYWHGVPYLGVGPGAHSFWRRDWDEGWRWREQPSIPRYVAEWAGASVDTHSTSSVSALSLVPDKGLAAAADVECLAGRQLFNERVICAMRLQEGLALDLPGLSAYANIINRASAVACDRGWLRRQGDRLVPTLRGRQCADSLAELFF